MKLRLLLTSTLFLFAQMPTMQAQVTVDVSKITCEQVLMEKLAWTEREVVLWLSATRPSWMPPRSCSAWTNEPTQGKHMPAYVIAEHIITDPVKFGEYVTKVRPMIAKHGGRYLTKGSTHKLPEGGHWKPERVVIIEFPDMDKLDTWYNSPEYQPLIALRKSCTSDQDMTFVLEGA